MEWKVAPSYQSWTLVKVDEDVKKAFVTCECGRCNGSGMYIIPPHFVGTCFKCNGIGKESKWVKAYTPEQYDKYIAAQERAKENKRKKEEERIQNLKDNSEENKKELLQKFGFDVENPCIYLVVGKDTYGIKDELKSRGGRYNAAFGWYFNSFNEVPEGYQLVPVEFDKVYDWNPMTKSISLKEDAKEIADEAKMSVASCNSEFIGEKGERLRQLKVLCTSRREFDSAYGGGYIYTFSLDGNILVWLTSANKPIEPNNTYILTGTVKKHEVYEGEKQTYLNRCIVTAA